jgi:hypothetical protein
MPRAIGQPRRLRAPLRAGQHLLKERAAIGLLCGKAHLEQGPPARMARNPITTPAAPTASAEDEVLIREIDEAVREDAVMTFFKDHGVKVLGAIVALIAALGGYLVWDNLRESRLEAQSETLVSALDYADQRDFATASEKAGALINDSSSAGARTAARFVQAAAALEQGETAKASTIYKAIAADDAAPPALRDLARVRDVAANFDAMKPADVIARLSSLAKPGNPWFGSAAELVAMAHLESGNRAEAGRLFAAIAKDEEQPETLRSRSRQMAGLLGVDAIIDVEKLLKDEGVTGSGNNGGAAGAQ